MGCDIPGDSFFSLTEISSDSSSIEVLSGREPIDDLTSSVSKSVFGDSMSPSSPVPQTIFPFVSRVNPLESDTYSSPTLSR